MSIDIGLATKEPAKPVVCAVCGRDCSRQYWLCDDIDKAWCPKCFPKTACGRGKHGEGCPTMCLEIDEGAAQ